MHKLKIIIPSELDVMKIKEKLAKNNINCDVTIENDFGFITMKLESEIEFDKKIAKNIVTIGGNG